MQARSASPMDDAFAHGFVHAHSTVDMAGMCSDVSDERIACKCYVHQLFRLVRLERNPNGACALHPDETGSTCIAAKFGSSQN